MYCVSGQEEQLGGTEVTEVSVLDEAPTVGVAASWAETIILTHVTYCRCLNSP